MHVCIYVFMYIYTAHSHMHIYLKAEYKDISRHLVLIQFFSSSSFFFIYQPVLIFENMTTFSFMFLFFFFVWLVVCLLFCNFRDLACFLKKKKKKSRGDISALPESSASTHQLNFYAWVGPVPMRRCHFKTLLRFFIIINL